MTSNLFSVLSNLTVFESCARSFLMRCASSMIRKRQGTFLRALTCAGDAHDDAIDATMRRLSRGRVDAVSRRRRLRDTVDSLVIMKTPSTRHVFDAVTRTSIVATS